MKDIFWTVCFLFFIGLGIWSLSVISSEKYKDKDLRMCNFQGQIIDCTCSCPETQTSTK